MVDPIGIFAGLLPPASEALDRFRKRNGVQNLFRLLKSDLAGRPGFPWEQVRRLAIDPTMQGFFIALLERHEVDEDAIRKRLVELCDPGGYRTTRQEFADELLASIRRNAHRAIPADRDAQQHIAKIEADRVIEHGSQQHNEVLQRLDDVFAALADQSGSERSFLPDMARVLDMVVKQPPPPDISQVINELRDSDVGLAVRLLAYIGMEPAKAVELIRDRPPWFAGDTAAAWRAVGELAMAAARWEDAERAFINAEALPDADRVRMLLRARECAIAADRDEQAKEYLERARTLAPDSVRVRVVEIRRLERPEQQLDELERLAPSDDKERLLIGIARVDALGSLERLDEAISLVEELLRLDESSLALLDRASGLVVLREQQSIGLSRRPPNRPALAVAAQRSLEIRRRLRGRGRDDETGGLLARATIATALAEDLRRAESLIKSEVSEAELSSPESRWTLADAALYVRLPERALEILDSYPKTWCPRERAIAAQAFVLADEPDGWHRGFALAAEVFENPDVRDAAAFALVVAGTRTAEIEWREDALAVMAEKTPVFATYLHAERLDVEGDHDGAEALLLQFADDPDALRGLADRAIASENWRRALAFSDQLLARGGRGSDRVRRAIALEHLGRRDAGLEELRVVAFDSTEPASVRGRAFELLAQRAERTDYPELLRLAVRWRELDADDPRPFWLEVYASAVLSRREQALELLDSGVHPPANLQEARLAAQVFARSLPPYEACRRIAALSDQFDRQDDRLEKTIFILSTRTDEPLDDPRLGERIRQAAESFIAGAPESDSVMVLDARDPARLFAELQRISRARDQHLTAAAREVTHGTTPLAVFAATVGRNVVDVASHGFVLPLGFSSDDLYQAERAAASNALGSPSVWDPVAIAVVAQLPDGVRERLKAGLPASVVSTSTLMLCDVADAEQDRRAERHTLSAEAGIQTTSAEAVARERETLKTALAFARELVPVPDVDPASPTPFDESLANEELDPSVRALTATVAVAHRRGLPEPGWIRRRP